MTISFLPHILRIEYNVPIFSSCLLHIVKIEYVTIFSSCLPHIVKIEYVTIFSSCLPHIVKTEAIVVVVVQCASHVAA